MSEDTEEASEKLCSPSAGYLTGFFLVVGLSSPPAMSTRKCCRDRRDESASWRSEAVPPRHVSYSPAIFLFLPFVGSGSSPPAILLPSPPSVPFSSSPPRHFFLLSSIWPLTSSTLCFLASLISVGTPYLIASAGLTIHGEATRVERSTQSRRKRRRIDLEKERRSRLDG